MTPDRPSVDIPWWKIAPFTVPTLLMLGYATGWRSLFAGDSIWWRDLRTPPPALSEAGLTLAWLAVFVALGVAVARVLSATVDTGRSKAFVWFVLQFVFGIVWVMLFYFRAFDLASIALLVTIPAAVLALVLFWRVDRVAAALFVPFLAWLTLGGLVMVRTIAENPGADLVPIETLVR